MGSCRPPFRCHSGLPILSCLYHGARFFASPALGSRMPCANPRCILNCCVWSTRSPMEHEISIPSLQEKLKSLASAHQLCLLDVREPWEAELCALPGSRLIPMGDMPSVAHRELDPDTHIVVYCHHGVRSLSVVLWLREQGFDQTQSLAGGIDAWARTVDPSMSRY